MERISPIDRFLMKISIDGNGCWLWTAALSTARYGQFNDGRRPIRAAHRWSYEYYRGPVPKGLQIDHLCRVRRCVNPEHLEAVTPGENSRRGFWATKTHCVRGHEYTKANTYHHQGRSGEPVRFCRACTLAKKKQRDSLIREARAFGKWRHEIET